MSEKTILAYDFGTTGLKAAVFSFDGTLLARDTVNLRLYVPHEGYAEQDPEEYWSALVAATSKVLALCRPADIAGVCLCAQWKGIIPVDRNGKVLRRSLIWMDTRAADQAARLNEITGSRFFSAQNYWAKLRWCHENNPEIFEEATDIMEVGSFIKWRLTGEKAVDISNDFIHSYDSQTDAFYDRNVRLSGMDKAKFPALDQSTDKVGEVNEWASEVTGIPKGVPVFSGSGDIPAITIGSGCQRVGKVHAYFGTSGWVGGVFEHDHSNVFRASSGFTKDRDIRLIRSLRSIGSSLDWTVRQLYHGEYENLKQNVYDVVNEEIADVPAGSAGVMATPWIAGMHAPMSDMARTVFIGLSLKHDRRHIINAMMEGICMDMRLGYVNNPVSCIAAVGGGANSDHWMQILSDVLQTEVSVPFNNQHAGALGAAACALVGLGEFDSLDQASVFVKERKHFYPDASKAGLYSELTELYCNLYKPLEPTFMKLNEMKGGY
ncbi:MAG: hypothetical protein IKT95_00200 [Spirochaetales bacterium]|nr:hypothetical protein [Spirochaetales bacterium]